MTATLVPARTQRDYLPAEAPRVLEALKRHGWNATSFQVLEPGFSYWFDADGSCVAYVDTGGAWVAAGAPIGPHERLGELTRAFTEAARAAGRRAAFFAVERRFLEQAGIPAIVVGEQPVWDATAWGDTLKQSKSLREQVRRSRAKGVRVRRLLPAEVTPSSPTRAAIDRLIERWVASRSMAQMGFLVELHPFSLPDERRYFVAEQAGKVVGFLAVVPVYERGGWFFEDLLRDPSAPNGTAELLVSEAMTALAAEGGRYVTLGLAPLAGEVAPLLKAARWLGAGLYDFEGLRAFKARLRPGQWEPIYLAWPGSRLPVLAAALATVDILRAFARGGLLRFGVQTLGRVPAFVVQALALLLIPWTVALALAGAPAWFPSLAVKLAWLALDGALVVGLLRLGARWQQRAAATLAGAVTLDALATLAQALAYNAPRAQFLWERAVLAVAVTAPMVAAALLWRGYLVRERLADKG